MGDDLCDLLTGDTVFLSAEQVVAEGFIRQALRHQGHHRHQRAIPQGEFVGAAPYLAEKDVVVEFCEFRGELPQGVPPRRLFDCHMALLLTVCCMLRR